MVSHEFFTSHPDSIILRKNLLYRESILGGGTKMLAAAILPSVDETFPCRVMSHPRQETGEKLFPLNFTGRNMFAPYSVGKYIYLFEKFLGFLRGFSKKSLKQVRTAAATLWSR